MIGSKFPTWCFIIFTMIPTIALSACPHEESGLVNFLDSSSWDSGQVPADGEEVVIEKPMLLNGYTKKFKSVIIRNGGKLIFDPTASRVRITSEQITIDDQGELHIGSTDCKYEGKAEILFKGAYWHFDDNIEGDPDFGKRFLGVKAGGVLEIHGKEKKSWTQLTKTLVPHETLYEDLDLTRPGIVVYEFDRDQGTLIQQYHLTQRKHVKKLKNIQDSSVLVLATRGDIFWSDKHELKIFSEKDAFVEELNDLIFPGDFHPFDDIKDAWYNVGDAIIIIADLVDKEWRATFSQNGDDKNSVTAGEMYKDINGIRYLLQNTVATVKNVDHGFKVRTVVAEKHALYELELADDVSSWQPGDRLVIASTDYDFEQAEEVKIVSVDGKKVQVEGEILNTHYGEIYETVDMRAEVGLLTRNVLIHSETRRQCEEETKACEELGFDNFGGHTKAIKGFKSYNIEGAEFYNMGQMTVLGSYPIHFHMCGDTDQDGSNPLIQSNSIHHSFSRCVTVHGSHGVHVKDNVAHDTYGHCYFLEDGGEKRTVFERNLGLTTRIGYLTPSDSEPTTFWLTSPLVSMIENHAAGTQGKRGIGIWYLFPDSPVGPSADKGFFGHREAKHTPISEFKDNVAHSNGRMGLGVFRRLREDHGILGCSTYDPREDPKKGKSSEVVPVVFNGFTGYKNREAHVKMRASASQLVNFKLADSSTGIHFNRIMLSGYQMVKDSLIIGESANVGKPKEFWVRTMVDGKWIKEKQVMDRSIPNHLDTYLKGIYLDSEGPMHIHNVEFKDFKTNEFRPACGILFKDDFRLGMGPSSTVKGLQFDFEEPEALRVCHKNMKTGNDEDAMFFKDLDGSLTGAAGLNLVSTDEYLQEGLNCELKELWNMTVCKGDFARFYMYPKHSEAVTYITKLGDPKPAKEDEHKRVSYIVRSDKKVVMHFKSGSLPRYVIRLMGVQKGLPVTVGFCMPGGAEEYDPGVFINFSMEGAAWKDDSDVIPAHSLDDLDQDHTGKNVFIDKEKRILFIKFIETKVRDMENDFADCPGSNRVNTACPWATIDYRRIESQLGGKLDYSKGECV